MSDISPATSAPQTGADALFPKDNKYNLADWLKGSTLKPETIRELNCYNSVAVDKFLTSDGAMVLPGKEKDEGPGLKKLADCVKNTPLPAELVIPPADWEIQQFFHATSVNAALRGDSEVKFDLAGAHFTDPYGKLELFSQTHGMTLQRDQANPNLVELIFPDPPADPPPPVLTPAKPVETATPAKPLPDKRHYPGRHHQ